MDPRQTLGRAGEALAVQYLAERGYRILERNYRCPLGEIDIIACERGELVFIEVKTRTSLAFGLPVESVTRTKQARIRRIALHYLAEKRPRYRQYRFDVVSILVQKGRVERLELIPNAF